MPRLGELLVREGVITETQLETGLKLHRRVGERLGTCLIELGLVGLDALARALAAQQNVVAVLAQHVAAIDPEIINLLPARVAGALHAIPFGYTQSRPSRLLVALRDPHTTPVEEIAFIAGMRVERAVAPEARIRACLERYYGIRSETKIGSGAAAWQELDLEPQSVPVSAEMETPSARPTVVHDPPTLSAPPPTALAPVVILEEAAPASQRSTAPPPPPYFAAADDGGEVDTGWDAITPDPRAGVTAPPDALRPFLDVEGAVSALRAATTRDEIGDTLVAWLQSAYGCGVVMIVKNGRALGWKGYAPDAEQHEIEWIGMPLAPISLFKNAYDGKVPYRGAPPPEGAALHERMWQLLHCEAPSEVIVGPILLGGRVINLLYAHPEGSHEELPPTAIEDMSRVASVAATEFARLIRRRTR